MGYARSALKSFKYSGYDTRGCSDLSLCICLAENMHLTWHTRQIDFCICSDLRVWTNCAWLMLPSCHTDWRYGYSSVLFLEPYLHSLESWWGWRGWCFYPLSDAQTSFDSSVHTDFFSLVLSSSQSDSCSISASLPHSSHFSNSMLSEPCMY